MTEIYNKKLGWFVTTDGYKAMVIDKIDQYVFDGTLDKWIEHNCPEDPNLEDPVNQLEWEEAATVMAEDDLADEGWV